VTDDDDIDDVDRMIAIDAMTAEEKLAHGYLRVEDAVTLATFILELYEGEEES
jgi:hypothetical protein